MVDALSFPLASTAARPSIFYCAIVITVTRFSTRREGAFSASNFPQKLNSLVKHKFMICRNTEAMSMSNRASTQKLPNK